MRFGLYEYTTSVDYSSILNGLFSSITSVVYSNVPYRIILYVSEDLLNPIHYAIADSLRVESSKLIKSVISNLCQGKQRYLTVMTT